MESLGQVRVATAVFSDGGQDSLPYPPPRGKSERVRKLLILIELTGRLFGKECVKFCKSVRSFLGWKRKSAGLPALLVVVSPGSSVLEKYVDVKEPFYVAAKTQVQSRRTAGLGCGWHRQECLCYLVRGRGCRSILRGLCRSRRVLYALCGGIFRGGASGRLLPAARWPGGLSGSCLLPC